MRIATIIECTDSFLNNYVFVGLIDLCMYWTVEARNLHYVLFMIKVLFINTICK